MYPFHEIQHCFHKAQEIHVINYAQRFPSDTRVILSDNILARTWQHLHRKIPEGELSYVRKTISDRLYKSVRNFDFLIDGERTPTLEFLRLFCSMISHYGLHIDLQKLLNASRLKFGEGGNAASAQLPGYLSPQLAYFVGAMRDGTIARSGKYEVSISQRDTRWLKLLKKLITETFKPSNTPAIRNNRVTLSNRPIFEYLHSVFDIPIGAKHQWGTPNIIKHAPLDLQKQYIRGFYDADGLSYKLGFCQVNKESLMFVKKTLAKLGITTGQLSSRKGKFHVLYCFNTSTRSHKDFIKIIGSLNPSKQRLFLPHNKTS